MLSFVSTLRRTAVYAPPLGRKLAVAALSLSLLGVAACGDDDPTGPQRGTYELDRVNGQSLPVAVGTDPATGTTIQVIAGSIELQSGNEFDLEISVTSGSGQTDFSADGDYQVDGDDITFETDAGEELTGSFDEDDDELDVTLALEGVTGNITATFVRQGGDDDDDDD